MNVCRICRNDAGEKALAKLPGIVQTSKCTETDCHCLTSFEKKPDGDIPKDATLAYSDSDSVKDYGVAFDVFFTNTGADTGCSVDSCSLF